MVLFAVEGMAGRMQVNLIGRACIQGVEADVALDVVNDLP
jgi:hypothetical protein